MWYAINVIGDEGGRLRREFATEDAAMRYAWEQLKAGRRVFMVVIVY